MDDNPKYADRAFQKKRRLKLATASALSALLIGSGGIATYAGFTDSGNSNMTATAARMNVEILTTKVNWLTPAIFMQTGITNVNNSETTPIKNNSPFPVKVTISNETSWSTIPVNTRLILKIGTTTVYNGLLQDFRTSSTATIPANSQQNVSVTINIPHNVAVIYPLQGVNNAGGFQFTFSS